MKVLNDVQRANACIVYPARAMTGVRHVVCPVDGEATSLGEDRALCGVNVENWYMEHKDFDPKTIGCVRCKAVWDRPTKTKDGTMSKPKFMPIRTSAEERLLRIARKYGRMKKFGAVIEHDHAVLVSRGDIERYVRLYEDEMKEAAEGLILAMSIDELERPSRVSEAVEQGRQVRADYAERTRVMSNANELAEQMMREGFVGEKTTDDGQIIVSRNRWGANPTHLVLVGPQVS